MKLPQLSLPWAIVASAVFLVLGGLVFAGKVSARELAMFIGGVMIPAFRAVDKTDPPAAGGGTGVAGVATLMIAGVFGFSIAMLACATSTKLQYGGQLDACVDKAQTRAEVDSCFATIRLEWDEAGAKPALVLDGGAQ